MFTIHNTVSIFNKRVSYRSVVAQIIQGTSMNNGTIPKNFGYMFATDSIPLPLSTFNQLAPKATAYTLLHGPDIPPKNII